MSADWLAALGYGVVRCVWEGSPLPTGPPWGLDVSPFGNLNFDAKSDLGRGLSSAP